MYAINNSTPLHNGERVCKTEVLVSLTKSAIVVKKRGTGGAGGPAEGPELHWLTIGAYPKKLRDFPQPTTVLSVLGETIHPQTLGCREAGGGVRREVLLGAAEER